MNKEAEELILKAQKNEITEHIVYKKLGESSKDEKTKKILHKISMDELSHYNFWKKYTKREIKPDKFKIWFYFLISKIFGLTFGLKLMERGEINAKDVYEKVSKYMPISKSIITDEDKHEKTLLNLINEDLLDYTGSIVLGLNDAILELTGALIGLTFALQNNLLTALAGLITGIAASLSMAASEYFSTKSEKTSRSPIKSAIYTGLAYIFTVIILIMPYFIFSNTFLPIFFTIFNAVAIIFLFNFYISIAKDLDFKKRFLEMLLITIIVSIISFLVGTFIRLFFGVEI